MRSLTGWNAVTAGLLVALMAAWTIGTFGRDARSGGPLGDSIEVHGHWVVEVLSPVGELLSRTEFDNALTPEGGTELALLLAGDVTSGATTGQTGLLTDDSVPYTWAIAPILATDEASRSVQCDVGWQGFQGTCYEESLEFPLPKHVATVEVPTEGPDAGSVVLHSTQTAPSGDAWVTGVGTVLGTGQDDPAAPEGFTTHYFPSGEDIAVTGGQQLQITVVISFS
jgi:hypothetical protein